MLCPNCKNDNPPEASFCFKCGYSLQLQTPLPIPTDYSRPELRKGFAIASLIISIISFFTLGFLSVGAVTGIVLGTIAIFKAKNKPAQYGGKGMAVVGIIISSLSVLVAFPLALIAAIAIPNLLASRLAANEANAKASLRTIASAEAVYSSLKGHYGTLSDLVEEDLIERSYLGAIKSGYRIEIRLKGSDFEALATPEHYGDHTGTGRRSFYLSSEDNVIRGADKLGLEANKDDPPLDGS